MKNKWKSMLAAGAALCMCAAMTGCGGGSSSKEMTLTDVFSQSGTHVWYNCRNSKKDSEILSYYVIEDGTVTFYYYPDGDSEWPSMMTLGDVAGMTDADVISYLKENTSACVLNDFTFTVKTDDSGNEVVSEMIHSDTGNGLSSYWFKSEIFYSGGAVLNPIESFQIFDAYFDGYANDTYYFDAYLVTKTDNKIDYVLNKVGDDGVTAE